MPEMPLWTPSSKRVQDSNLSRFKAAVEKKLKISLAGFEALHAWSIADSQAFWAELWEFCNIRGEYRGDRLLLDNDKLPEVRFFPDARLNYAQNLLIRNDDTPALIFRSEHKDRRCVSWKELQVTVAEMHHALVTGGIRAGDRIAGIVPNMPETTAMLIATSSLGAVWSSCSPDFGERGILDRFGQINPRVLVTCDGYSYNGRIFDIGEKVAAVRRKLPSVERVVIIDNIGTAKEMAARIPGAKTLDVFIREMPQGNINFAQVPFDHPLYILYSSGTTGIPKCIVHRAGGVFLKHLSELVLHCDLKREDRLFYFTTCGWMMWNWLMSGLAAGATLVLYDGSPFWPNERALFDMADEEGITIFGTSAKFIDAVRKTGWRPRDTHRLTSVRTMLSTGSPLASESFEFVYDAIKPDLHLASISGGTDICGCFVAGNPLVPVWAGVIQGPTLGLAVDVLGENGEPLIAGKGELVCKNAFPSMPLGFWNDPDGAKYHAAYFDRFDNVWCHGDFAEWTEHGGIIIHGRSDATLNPGGVRIGTAEIYAQVEQVPEVVEALAIGQNFDNDVRIVLFVRLKDGVTLDEALASRIRAQIRSGASPRHVPAKIVKVTDIPRTKSGKITELAVRDIVHGRAVKNREALANPEALELFRDLPELRS
ncbi:MAG TPA: acetoacetate--CoA ligase [Aestuariivirgaceae bacterium]|nr:acetoacetate--CoA ligase [Aestuariivirgaceae bacterium]